MTRPLARFASWAVSLLLFTLPGPAGAVIPTGSFEIALDANQSIWLSSAEDGAEFCEGFEEGFGGDLQACSLSLLLDAKGKITGSALVAAENGALSIDLAGPVKGKLKGDDSGNTRVSFSMKLAGEGGSGAAPADVKATVRFEGQIDSDGRLTGSWDFKLCVKQAGCEEDQFAQTPEMLPSGDWLLVLDIDDEGDNKLGGDASAVLADGVRCPYTIGGKYNAKQDLASLKLSPATDACNGTSIRLKDVRVGGPLEAEIKYKLFGYKGAGSVESE